VLVAVVNGEAGRRIQQWRERHDPAQAVRLPPHVTLCYWAAGLDEEALARQVRHAFTPHPRVRLTTVHEFDNEEHTFYAAVTASDSLDAARRRLYDGTHCALPTLREWTWHVTCVRDSRGRDLDELRRAAATLDLDLDWEIDMVAWLELRDDRYAPVATWQI
jgi:2'-5' RNA ligase